MKGYRKGVNIRCSADSHFAEGGSVSRPKTQLERLTAQKKSADKKPPVQKRPASDYEVGGNKEANKRDGWAPNLPKAAREDIEARFGKTPPPVKKAGGGLLSSAVQGVKAGLQGKPRGGGILGGIAAKLSPEKKMPSMGSSPKSPPAAPATALARPAPAARGRGVPGFSGKPLIGSKPALARAKGGSVCTPAKMKSIADAEISKHVAAPAPKGHKGLPS